MLRFHDTVRSSVRPSRVTSLLAVAGFAALLGAFPLVGCRFQGRPRDAHVVTDVLENEPWGEPHEVIVTVNDRPITRGEFYLRVLRRFGTMKLLTGLVKEELFLQEAERLEITVTSAEVGERVDRIIVDMEKRAGGRDELAARYRQEGLDLGMVRRDLEREVSTQLLIGKVTLAHREINDEVLREYYQQTYGQRRWVTRQIAYSFRSPPEVSEADGARERLEARNKALRAAARVREGADFQEIARGESEDPMTAKSGGMLGPIHRDTKMRYPEFKQAIFRLEEGDVSEPVENPQGGFHVFLAEKVVDSESFVDCREKMIAELKALEPEPREIEGVLRQLQSQGDVRLEALPFAAGAGVGAGADRSETPPKLSPSGASVPADGESAPMRASEEAR